MGGTGLPAGLQHRLGLVSVGQGTRLGTTFPAGLQHFPAPECGVGVGVTRGVAVGVTVGRGVAVGVTVGRGVAVGVTVGLGVAVGVGFGVAVGLGVAVGVGSPGFLQHLNFGFTGTPAG